MEYTVAINGKTYKLPTRNEEMDALISRMSNIEKLVRNGELTRKQSLKEQYEFVALCIPEDMPDFSVIDMSDLEVARLEIIRAYNEPAIKAKVDAMMGQVGAVVNSANFKTLLLLAELKAKSEQG